MELSEQVKQLEEKVKRLEEDIRKTVIQKVQVELKLKEYENLSLMMIPVRVYTHKKRGNTTVKFSDGSQQTVKRRKGEKDCIETAIAYCVLKQLLTAQELKLLISNKEEH